MKKYSAFLFLLFPFLQVLSQETGAIKGKILSSDGYPLVGISIKFKQINNIKNTNTVGEFNFEEFPVGTHTIILEGMGLQTQSREIKVSKNEVTYVEFILEETITSLKEVIIVIKDSPNNKKETLFSGLTLKPIDIPQSVQIIGKNIIQQQQTLRLSEVVKNVNGIYVGSARGGAQESFWSRGYDMSANNLFKNGFRMTSGSMPEVATLEKIEVLKGGSALLFGNVTPGGVVNMVTKAPSFKEGGEVNLQHGSYAFYKPTLDIYGPLHKKIAYRLISTYENSESFRDLVTRERIYLNPSVLIRANSKTEITVQGDFLLDNWIPDFGTGAIGKEIVDLLRNTYLGASWSNGTTQQTTMSGLVSHTLNSNWKLNFNSSLQNFERTWEGTERIQPMENGDWNRPLGKYKLSEQLIGEQLNLQGKFLTGKIKHDVFAGIDADKSVTANDTYVFNPIIYDTVSIFDANITSNEPQKPSAIHTKTATTTGYRLGLFIQDLVSISEKIKVLAGLRWSYLETQVATLTIETNEISDSQKNLDKVISPKLGFVFQPTKNMSLFTSYSNSFTPNSGVTVTNQPLKASLIDQYEIGIKKDFGNGRFSTNITAYQIVNSNLAQQAEFALDGSLNTNSNVKILSGETTSRGIEIDCSAKPIEGLSVLAGYSYNDMRFTKTSGTTGSFIEGERLTRTPYNTANFSLFYTFQSGKLKGVSLGAISNYIGNRIGGWNNTIGQTMLDRTIPIAGYTVVDFSIGYKWRKLNLLCKLSNVSNELNYTVHENYSFNPIAPRQLLTSINYQF